MFSASQPTSEFSFMPSGGGGGKKGGGGGSVTPPTISIPPGLLQSLNSIQGIGQYGESLFNPLASLGNWAAGIATGGNNIGVGPFQEQASQAGPTVNIGTGGPPGHDAWATSFDPQTGQITFTNSQTGGTFQEFVASPQASQWLPADQIKSWTQLYQNRGAGPVGGQGFSNAQLGGGGSPFGPNGPSLGFDPQLAGGGQGGNSAYNAWFSSLGPSLQSAWNQIQSIGGIENQTQAFTNQENFQAAQLYGEGQNMLQEATTGRGLFPSQQAFINQQVQAEQSQLSQQLASEGLGSSTSGAILRGEAGQQGAATAGQLVQGNIAAAQNQLNLAQGAQKLALGGQTLQLGEAQAMAGLAQGFQAQTWGEAIQAYQTLGQMMSTTGALYGIDVTGYSNILQANIAQGQLSLEAALGNAQAAIGGMQSLGSGLGAILGNQGLSGLLGGGAFGGAGAAAGDGLSASSFLGSIGSQGAITSALGSSGAAAGGAGGIFGGLFSGIGSALGSAGSGILGALGGLLAFL